MRKILTIAAVLVASSVVANAQTMLDALNVSQNNYYGTARTIGIGNAVTAVGTDLGSVGINPAGSAVAGYSQITVSPGIVFSTTVSQYAPSYAAYSGQQPSKPLPTSQIFAGDSRSMHTRFNLPNIGMMMRFNTGRDYGVRAVTFGIVSNQTNNYTDETAASGINRGTSITGAFAAFATTNANGREQMMPSDVLSRSHPFDSDYYWNYVAGYWGGLINFNKDGGTYFGSAETVDTQGGQYNYFVKGDLSQRNTTRTFGSKNDIVFNLGLDINDNVFLGFNLGLPAMNYNTVQNFSERAYSDPSTDFVVVPEYIGSDGKYVKENPTTFDQAQYQYSYATSVSGVYGKFGAIVLPTDHLRIGAAIQTPTAYTIRETWQVREDCYFGNGSHQYSTSPNGDYRYRLVGPYSVNAGLAYTVGSIALLSVDYEMTDFSIMKYKTEGGGESDNFFRVNRLNNLFCGVSHSVRAGVEIKPIPFFAIRLGGSFKSDPTCWHNGSEGPVDAYIYDRYFDKFENGYYTIDSKRNYNNDHCWSVSGGFGYISAGSFFADIAARWNSYATSVTEPYSCYLENVKLEEVCDDVVTVYSPAIRSSRRLWDVVLTLGWRF